MTDNKGDGYNVASMTANRDIAGDPMERPGEMLQRGLEICTQCGGKRTVPGGEHPDPTRCAQVTCPNCQGRGHVTDQTVKGGRYIERDQERSRLKNYIYLGELRNCVKKLQPATIAETIHRELPSAEAEAVAREIMRLLR
jgi:hypothetical protein